MSVIKKTFYNIFWQNKSCQNLFLLSKEELLETISFGSENNSFTYSSNRIIISNTQNNIETIDTIKFRNENYNIILGSSIDEKVEYFKPIVEEFFDKKFKKSIEKLTNDIEKKGWKFIIKVLKLLSDEEKREKNTIKLLQDYGFIGKHLNNFNEVETYFESLFLPKKGNDLINEQTINTFFEGVKFIKEIYVNNSYKKLYTTNQVLVNTLNSEDDFKSRIKLFHHLYESKIITPSKEDAFIECSNCEPGTYKGVFQLRLNPKKLKELKCPVCSNELTYFVPYELHNDIYNIVKEKDGLLQNALCNRLEHYNIEYRANQTFLNNLEIDCIFEIDDVMYVVETKMYKINTTKNKLKSKIREHYGKLAKDIDRLLELNEFKSKKIKPLLLLNILNRELLREIINELKSNNLGSLYHNTSIINLSLLKFEN